MRISDWSSDVCSSDLQRGHGAGGVLDHVAHDRLEAVGDAVELVLQRRGDAHVAADQVAVPADSHADALHVAGTTHRHGPAAADAVEHVVADHAAAGVHAIGVDAGLRPGDRKSTRMNSSY